MTSLFSKHHWGSLNPKDIPEDTHTLYVGDVPSNMDEFHRLLAAVPQLTRLTIDHYYRYPLDWKAVGKALLQTPDVNYLDCSKCDLKDDDLLKLLEGCTLELCELKLVNRDLKLRDEALIRRLEYFTNLQ